MKSVHGQFFSVHLPLGLPKKSTPIAASRGPHALRVSAGADSVHYTVHTDEFVHARLDLGAHHLLPSLGLALAAVQTATARGTVHSHGSPRESHWSAQMSTR